MATEVWIFVLMATKGWNYVTNGDTKRWIFVRMAIKKWICALMVTKGSVFVYEWRQTNGNKRMGFCTNCDKWMDLCANSEKEWIFVQYVLMTTKIWIFVL